MAESHEYDIPAAKAALSLLRVYQSTGVIPRGHTSRDLRAMASSYTGKLYPAKSKIQDAIADLTEWLKGKE